MRTLKGRVKRQSFTEVFNFGKPSDVLTDVPVERDGEIVTISTKKPYVSPKDVDFRSFTPAKVYDLGDITPIHLYNNMSSTERLSYVQQFERDIDVAMSNSKTE